MTASGPRHRSKRPNLHNAVCHRAWRLSDLVDRILYILGVDQGEARKRQVRAHKGTRGRLNALPLRIADLYRRARGPEDRTRFSQQCVMAVRSVANGGWRAVVAGFVAVPDRQKFRHGINEVRSSERICPFGAECFADHWPLYNEGTLRVCDPTTERLSVSDQQACGLKQVATVFVPVADQERALRFYVDALGFQKRVDFVYGDGVRWIEVAPPGSTFALALVPPGEGQAAPSNVTRCAFVTDDADATHAALIAAGVSVDPIVGRSGTSRPGLVSTAVAIADPQPAQFCFCDPDGNRFLAVELPSST